MITATCHKRYELSKALVRIREINMVKHVLPGIPQVEMTLRRSARARRISLRISQLDGRVTLTLPVSVSEAEALEFAVSKTDWIRHHLDRRPEEVSVGIGSVIPIEGSNLEVIEAKGRRVYREDNFIAVPANASARRLQSWLKELARDRLTFASDEYARHLGRSYQRITIRDTRSRWGSCTSDGGLMYSWRLVLAPPRVLQYVAAHEVSHLEEMNHSPAFWATVQRLFGPYDEERKWLRQEGAALHRYRF